VSGGSWPKRFARAATVCISATCGPTRSPRRWPPTRTCAARWPTSATRPTSRTVAEATAWLGDISVLVNNVGIGGPRAGIADIALDEWDRTLAINITAMFHAMKLVVPGMKRLGGGAVVNFSTGSTRTRLPGRTAYVVSKFAVEGLTLNAARELGPDGIRVNAILPGMIDNARMQGIIAAKSRETGRTTEAIEADYLRFISLRAKTQPSDLAAMVLFLASDAGRLITGELIAVSGNLEWED